MRFRSLMALLFISFTALGLSGCGSSGSSSEYVMTGTPEQPNTGSLTFQFARAQQSFEVDAQTVRLRLEFFENVSALGAPVVTTTVDFQPTVTVENLPTSVRSVKITALDGNRIPLSTLVQSVVVVAGENTVVQVGADPVPVTLLGLRLIGDAVSRNDLTSVSIPVNGTSQVFLEAEYSDGSKVIVGAGATYSHDPNVGNSENILEIGELGQLRGLSQGQTSVIVEFGGQSLTLPVGVGMPAVNPDPGPSPDPSPTTSPTPGPTPGPTPTPPAPNGNTGSAQIRILSRDPVVNYTYSNANASFTAQPLLSGNVTNGVRIALSNGSNGDGKGGTNEWWFFEFRAPNGEALTAGSFTGAQRAAFADPGRPGLDVSGNGTGNNTLTGSFVVQSVEFGKDGDGDPTVLSFSGQWEMNEGTSFRTSGTVTFEVGNP